MASPPDITPDEFIRPFQLTQTQRRKIYRTISPSRPELSQKGKVVIVTGAGGGIGYRTVEAFAQAGAAGIVLVGRHERTLQKTAEEVAGGVPTLVVPTDTAEPKAVERLYLKTKERFGRADVLVHLAGVAAVELIKDSDQDDWWRTVEINFRGSYNVVRQWTTVFGEEGTMINSTSITAALTSPAFSAYGISKMAQIRLTEYLDAESPNIRAFALHPGVVPVESGRGMLVDAFAHLAGDDPSFAAAVMVYLASDRADYLQGGFVNVNWDFEELELHQEEFKEKRLGHLGFIDAPIGAGPYKWEK